MLPDRNAKAGQPPKVANADSSTPQPVPLPRRFTAVTGWLHLFIQGTPINAPEPDATTAQTHMKAEATEATVSALASKVTYAGTTAAVYGGFTANEIAAFGGLLVAVIGLVVQLYYKRKTAQHDKFMATMHLPPDLGE